jgi:hypothetical protein
MTRSERIALLSRENGNATVLLAAARSSSSAAFELPVEEVMAPLNNAPGTEHHPSTTADGLLVYFERRSPQTVAIFAAPRADITSAFTAGASVTVDGESLAGVVFPVISSDGETLYFVDTADARLHAAERGANALSFGASSVRSTMAVAHPVLSDDGLTLFYAASGDILVSTRTATTEAFAPGVAVDGINSLERDVPLAITADGCVLMLASARDGGVGGTDIYEAVR